MQPLRESPCNISFGVLKAGGQVGPELGDKVDAQVGVELGV